jgi:hypothetical protein
MAPSLFLCLTNIRRHLLRPVIDKVHPQNLTPPPGGGRLGGGKQRVFYFRSPYLMALKVKARR